MPLGLDIQAEEMPFHITLRNVKIPAVNYVVFGILCFLWLLLLIFVLLLWRKMSNVARKNAEPDEKSAMPAVAGYGSVNATETRPLLGASDGASAIPRGNIFCTNCGSASQEGTFCYSCGAALLWKMKEEHLRRLVAWRLIDS
jgi:hypothetical protein